MRLGLVLAVGLLLLCGCGVLDDEAPALPPRPDPAVYGPSKAAAGAPQDLPIPDLQAATPTVARALDAGEIGVVDITGTVGVKPGSLETSDDSVLEGLEWSRWGADGAEGSGKLRMLVCQPTCASGNVEHVPARITLTGVTRCDGRRYFAAGTLAVDPALTPEGQQPATYVRAPC
jgi:hypothetical protein